MSSLRGGGVGKIVGHDINTGMYLVETVGNMQSDWTEAEVRDGLKDFYAWL